MSILKLIIKREFIAKVRNKSFIVMTFLSPLLMVGLVAFVVYLSTMKSDIKQIALHDETGLFVNDFKNSDEYQYLNYSNLSLESLKDSLSAEKFEGLLFIPKTENNSQLASKIQYISNESPDPDFIFDAENTINKRLTQTNMQLANLDTLAIKNAQAEIKIALAKTSGEENVKGLNYIKVFIGASFGYLIMMFIIIYGNMVMRSVIEEKTNRIIEIIISSVKPFQLMMGKIIGTSLAGVLQFIIWAIIGGVLLFIISLTFGIETTATAQVAQNTTENSEFQLYLNEFLNIPIFTLAIGFIIYFIGGYFLYSSIYAAIGAAVDNETDSQQFLLPIILPLMLAVYVGFFSVLNEPHGTVATTFSMIPLTSPIVMLMRIPFGVPAWQIILSLIILFGTFFGVVWFAAKIYRVGILMYGKKPTWKELFRWLKY
ncbi:ABC transporter permease [Flavobacterium sp. NST-5]|uniref:ABC transporter permease n=1 Tax=Flavobacterium ichthyis TaxID=2698827 RepID=A0ABW9Z771_9FLAO|nr:ABC transporter permease [Flavobacterium ichthyis]NBL64546.1 ABC transporter permease [Flavobacterium ichthyis]